MSRDWKLVAKGIAPEIPDPELEKVVDILRALETQFAPLLRSLPHDTEPALVFPPFPAPEEHA
ncbi:MAG TPA: hypothetical protein VFS12_08315 [Terriglobia bacterium]|nr:hypothetical protein [Terriglobia bacterium]